MEIKFVSIPLPMDFSHYVFVIIVTKGTAEFVVVHVGLAFPLSPASGHFIRIGHLELSIGAFPGDAICIRAVGEQF